MLKVRRSTARAGLLLAGGLGLPALVGAVPPPVVAPPGANGDLAQNLPMAMSALQWMYLLVLPVVVVWLLFLVGGYRFLLSGCHPDTAKPIAWGYALLWLLSWFCFYGLERLRLSWLQPLAAGRHLVFWFLAALFVIWFGLAVVWIRREAR